MRIRPLCHLSVRRIDTVNTPTPTHDNRFAFGRKFSPIPAKCQEFGTYRDVLRFRPEPMCLLKTVLQTPAQFRLRFVSDLATELP